MGQCIGNVSHGVSGCGRCTNQQRRSQSHWNRLVTPRADPGQWRITSCGVHELNSEARRAKDGPTSLLSTTTMAGSSQAEVLKAEGNALFVQNDFSGAYKKYTAAIKLDNQNAILYCNRAACSFGLNRWGLDSFPCFVTPVLLYSNPH